MAKGVIQQNKKVHVYTHMETKKTYRELNFL